MENQPTVFTLRYLDDTIKGSCKKKYSKQLKITLSRCVHKNIEAQNRQKLRKKVGEFYAFSKLRKPLKFDPDHLHFGQVAAFHG